MPSDTTTWWDLPEFAGFLTFEQRQYPDRFVWEWVLYPETMPEEPADER